VEDRPGLMRLAVSGSGARKVYGSEGGGHRWQRIPPTEKRGRVQTSTVTVAVMDPETSGGVALNPADVEIVATRGSGPGGQNRNKVASCIVATHRPTGMQVRIDNERSQHQNREKALQVLRARLSDAAKSAQNAERDAGRRQQVGSGMRGDKVRTYRTQDDQVTDHRTGQRWRLKDWMRGIWE